MLTPDLHQNSSHHLSEENINDIVESFALAATQGGHAITHFQTLLSQHQLEQQKYMSLLTPQPATPQTEGPSESTKLLSSVVGVPNSVAHNSSTLFNAVSKSVKSTQINIEKLLQYLSADLKGFEAIDYTGSKYSKRGNVLTVEGAYRGELENAQRGARVFYGVGEQVVTGARNVLGEDIQNILILLCGAGMFSKYCCSIPGLFGATMAMRAMGQLESKYHVSEMVQQGCSDSSSPLSTGDDEAEADVGGEEVASNAMGRA
ncbi:MAG: hypothetical protein K0U37_02250 [Gammaproteobacteria bacterium]|nr:hypothetical protein [Gammaproteobacteria bacterium]